MWLVNSVQLTLYHIIHELVYMEILGKDISRHLPTKSLLSIETETMCFIDNTFYTL